MERLIKSIRDSLSSGNYIAAITLAVTLPDICGNIECPDCDSTEKKYTDWCKRNLEDYYRIKVDESNFLLNRVGISRKKCEDGKYELTFLKSVCLYHLRCALLHSGHLDLEHCKKKSGEFDEFEFIDDPESRWYVKLNPQTNKTTICFDIQLFCENMCKAVELWLKDHPTNLGLKIQ